MKKTLIAALICSASVVGVGAGSAFAGEVTGTIDNPNPNKPTYTPISPLSDKPVHTSACAYSGLEDGVTLDAQGNEVPTPSGTGITQTPHYEAGATLPPGLPARNPGYNCVGLAPGRP